MKIKSALALTVAAALLVSGVQTVRAADMAADTSTEATTTEPMKSESPTPAHKAVSSVKKETTKAKAKTKKAAKKAKKAVKKPVVKKDAATTTTEPTSTSGQ